MTLKTFWKSIFFAATFLLAANTYTLSQDHKGPLRLIVAFAPGSAADQTARIIGSRMSELLSLPVVVENKPGAGGILGTDLVAKAQADGKTLLLATSSQIVFNPNLYKSLPFDVNKDFVSVALLTRLPLMLLVHPSLPVKTLDEFIDFARTNPTKVSFGSAGQGSSTHLVPELLKRLRNFDMLHVPYRGQGPALTDLLAGNISVLFNDPGASQQYIEDGRLNALGVGGTQSIISKSIKIPSFDELGLTEFPAYTWNAILAPAGTSKDVVEKLNTTINNILKEPSIRDRLTSRGGEVLLSTPQSTDAFIKREQAFWRPVINGLGLEIK